MEEIITMNTIEIIYICTNLYKNFVYNFIASSVYFWPNAKKTIKILADDLKVVSEILEKVKEDYNIDISNIELVKITDLPYPLINTGKYAYINDYIDDESDYVFYFDADTKFIKKNDEFWSNLKNVLDMNKILITSHIVYNYSFYENFYAPEQRKSRIFDMEIFKNVFDIKQDSYLYDKLHIPCRSHVWAQVSVIAAKTDIMKRFSFVANKEMQEAMLPKCKGKPKYVLPDYPEEAVTNKMIYDSYIGKNTEFDYSIQPYAINDEVVAEKDFSFVLQKYNPMIKEHFKW